MRLALFAPLAPLAAALWGCCPCLTPEDGPSPPPLDLTPADAPPDQPPPQPPAESEPASEPQPDEECEWFYEVAYACTNLPDAPVEPCLVEEGSICDGRLHGAAPIQVVHGSGFGCVLFDSGQVKCWGRNSFGVLGLGHDEGRGDDRSHMGEALRFVDLGDDAHVVELSAGSTHVCALMASGRVKCWGGNLDGGLGLGDLEHRGDHRGEMGDRLPYVDLGHRRMVHIAAGQERTCALGGDGRVRCWGENLWGYLGQGDVRGDQGDELGEMGSALAPVDLGTEHAPIASLHTYGRSTCAVFEDRRVKCWGANTHGQLGLGHEDDIGDDPAELGDALPYVDLGGHSTVRTLALGHRFACAVLMEGGVKCWGELYGGRLGRPTDDPSDGLGDAPGEMGEALPYVDLGRDDDPIDLVAGFDAACALFADGWIKCWGENFLYQLGTGDDVDWGDDPDEMGEALPYVTLGRPAVALFAGGQTFCAWTRDDELWCWGSLASWMKRGWDDGPQGDVSGEMVRIDWGE